MRKLIGPSFVSLGFSFFFFIFGESVFNVLSKHFRLLDFSASEVGFIMSGHGIGGLIVIPALVFLMDKVRIKKTITTGYILFAAASSMFFFQDLDPSLYFLPRIFQGVFFTMMMISFVTELSHVIPKEVRLAGFAIFGLMGQIPGSFSIILGEILLNEQGIFWVIITSFICFGLSFLLLQFVKESNNHFSQTEPLPDSSNGNRMKTPHLKDFIPVLRNRKLFPYFTWVFCLGYTFGTILSFLPQILESNGLSEIRTFFIYYPITVIVVRSLFSRYFDKISRFKVIALPLFCLPLSLLFLPEVNAYWLMIFPGFLYGIAHGVLFPVLTASMIDFAPLNFRGRMTLLFQSFLNIGLFLAANIGGIIGDWDIKWTYWSATLLVSFGVLLFLFIVLRRRIAGKSV